MINWRTLVLDEGDFGITHGRLLAVGGHFQIVTADGRVTRARGGTVAVSGGVRLILSQPDQTKAFRRLTDEWVTVWGRVGDLVLHVTDVSHTASPEGMEPEHDDPPAQRRSLLPRSLVERDLIQSGALVATWEKPLPGAAPVTIALAREPDRVRAALQRVYGNKLEVVESTRSAVELDQLTSALDERLLVAVGLTPGPDQQLQVRAKLWHLPSTLARRLEADASAYDLDVLVAPVRAD